MALSLWLYQPWRASLCQVGWILEVSWDFHSHTSLEPIQNGTKTPASGRSVGGWKHLDHKKGQRRRARLV